MKKHICAVAFVSAIILLSTCGCAGGIEGQKKKVLEHLESKQGESFEIVSFYGENIDMPYDEIVCKNQNGDLFYSYIKKENGKQVIHDDYFGIVIADEYRMHVEEILDRYISDYKYFFNFNCGHFDDNFDASTKLPEALETNQDQMFSNSYIFVNKSTAAKIDDATFDAMCSELRESGLLLYVAIYQKDDSDYEIIDETHEVDSYLPDDYRIDPIFKRTINQTFQMLKSRL